MLPHTSISRTPQNHDGDKFYIDVWGTGTHYIYMYTLIACRFGVILCVPVEYTCSKSKDVIELVKYPRVQQDLFR